MPFYDDDDDILSWYAILKNNMQNTPDQRQVENSIHTTLLV